MEIVEDEMYCRKCKTETKDDWKICPTCGMVLKTNENCEETRTEGQMFQISAGDLTVSCQRRYITEVFIENQTITIKNYMNTKKFSTPIEYRFTTDEIVNIERCKKILLRKIHKIRLVSAGVMFLLTFATGLIYFVFASLLLTILTITNAQEKAVVLNLSDEKKIFIYYMDEDDIVLVERAIDMAKKNK